MLIARQISAALQELGRFYPIVYLGGPRQAGKTTLLKNLYPGLPYANLEDPELRLLAEQDPRRFLKDFAAGAVLDEAQRVPQLFSYLQVMVDADKRLRFVLSGSQNFLLMEKITQSLAGRVGILNLFPLGFSEVENTPFAPLDLENFVWRGGFPGLHEQNVPPEIFFNNYVQTYLERDVRLLKNVGDLSVFNRFLRLCAGRVGQPLNLSTLATDLSLSVNTVKAWFSVLEASYMIFYQQPFYANFNKRIIKTPKFYFFDTGLICHLLGIGSPKQLETHHYFGNIVENAIIADLYKKRSHAGKRPVFWFWQDQHGNEVDLLIEEEGMLKAIEIKSSQTFNTRLLSGLTKWAQVSGNSAAQNYLVYAGSQTMELKQGQLLPWRTALMNL
ncbi:MAG: ATP-binding protein [Bacteroidetes bacterium]|nr:ATP-binding protein [Bacteroidota bacterium]